MTAAARTPAETAVPAGGAPLRRFGPYRLLRLLGRSERTMAWHVGDERSGEDLVLVLPRAPLPDAEARAAWAAAIARASRLRHPLLAPVRDSGVHEGWPWVTHPMQGLATLPERIGDAVATPADAAAALIGVLGALAAAHDAGVAHHDVQAFLVLTGDRGALQLAGLGVAAEAATRGSAARSLAVTDTEALLAQRADAARDVLAAGLLLHGLLAGSPALGEADLGRALRLLPPSGQRVLKLPWALPRPVPEPLRAIVDRATDAVETRRYQGARSLQRALEGWRASDEDAGGRPLALLLDRVAANGVLPASPGAAQRVVALSRLERGRTAELAQVVLEDAALTVELMRAVHAASFASQGTAGHGSGGDGGVVTVRRAIAMVGTDGVRRVSQSLRPWPGHLHGELAPGASALQQQLSRCQRAMRLALALRPAPYDAEVVTLAVLWQGLGRLLMHYHFPDEAQQVRALMQPQAAPARDGASAEPASPMEEAAACGAVLGADMESLALALLRQWGTDASVQAMARRLPRHTPPRRPDGDDDVLRCLASCAHEAVDALAQPPRAVNAALQRVLQRYGPVLGFGARELQAALQGSAAAAVPAAGEPAAAAPA